MPTPSPHYRRAAETLDYIARIKQEISHLLYARTRFLYSGLHLPEDEVARTLSSIHEAIDDLYHPYSREASRIVESEQQQDDNT